MARPTRYGADSIAGRIMLALRPGSMESSAMTARFGNTNHSTVLSKLVGAGLVVKKGAAPGDGGIYSLTDAGREMCPARCLRAAAPHGASQQVG